MKTRLLTTLAALLLALSSWAVGVEIDDIYYELDSSTKTATVTYTGSTSNNPNTAYKGNIAIPASVSYGGTTYTVASIGRDAFRGCTGLASISIPASVTSIGINAFRGCTGLTSFTIPSSVTTIGNYAFQYCSGLASIKVEAGNTAYDSRENCNAIIETASNTLVAGCMNTTIPNSVTAIGDYAFEGCTGLTSFTIPSSVTTIGDWAFHGCTGLASISIPASVTTIGNYAFLGCTGLTSIKVEEGNTAYDSRENCNAIIETASNTLVAGCMNTTIPNSVTAIGDVAFEGCTGLTSLTIPSSVTKIGDYAFYGCSGLTDIYALRTDPAAYNCSADAFVDVSATLHVPIGSKEAYAATAPWSNFKNIVEYDASGIEPIGLTPTEADAASYYNLQGQRIARPQRGQIVIQRNADGTGRKVLVK